MANSGKWLHVRVTDLKTGQSKANVRIPVSLANFGMKMAARYGAAGVEDMDMDQILAELEESGEMKFVEVDDEEKGEHVEVFIK